MTVNMTLVDSIEIATEELAKCTLNLASNPTFLWSEIVIPNHFH